MAAPRHFVYISDAKLDMLAPQLPKRFWRSLQSSLTIEAAGMKAAVNSAREPEHRFSRLQRVIKHLEATARVGTVEAPETYFKGTLSMQFMLVGSGLAFWGGLTQNWQGEDLFVGLAGSAQHLLGKLEKPERASANSYTPEIMKNIAVHLEELGLAKFPELRQIGEPLKARHSLWHVMQSIDFMQGGYLVQTPPEDYEFFCRRLLYDEIGHRTEVILGTPLYVALGE